MVLLPRRAIPSSVRSAMTVWLISDTHFDHANMLKFVNYHGVPIRPGFPTLEAMNEHMVEAWNSVVKDNDKVYHLGDVAMRLSGLRFVSRLKGKKRLVRGNHDIYPTTEYLNAGFQEIHGMRVLANLLLTHAPVHPEIMGRFRGNVHGHIHERPSPLGPYLNVSVEPLHYTPITLEDALSRMPRHPAEGRPEWMPVLA
jgi:calcineurin-like phosphoesterase family protein